MKYIVFLRFILILLFSFSPLKGGNLGDYLSHESDSTSVLFFCENGILKVTPILDDIFKITLYPGRELLPEFSFVILLK
ncbi:hypothetical protein E3V55_03530 [Candidatus Marinimicrobia bacterium MT.SAG.3]|nr:hypothetical protein E3V55_03530 [Candidatus Marinimicrobia bacterium MT.SAG.3]